MQPQNKIMQSYQNYNTTTIDHHQSTQHKPTNKKITTNNYTNNIHHSRSHGSTTQACAACKYQRRKCAADCVLAPYFPHDRQRQFLNAHHLFGVSNIVKIVAHLDPPAKDQAMRTIIFQSDARAADPVGGCYRMIRDLEQQISIANAELEIVLHHLALCRAAAVDPGDCIVNVDPFGAYGEEWRAPTTAVEDISSSWGFMHGESTSSSFAYQDHDGHVRKFSMDGCNVDIKPILDSLSIGEDDHDDINDQREGLFKFDSNGTIISSNNGILIEEKANLKEEDLGCYPSHVTDNQDLKDAATFFTLANCDS